MVLDNVPGGQLLFQIDREPDQWFLQPRSERAAVAVNREPVQKRVPLGHLSLIQTGHHVFIFVERDDPNVATAYAAERWLIGRLRNRLADTQRTLTWQGDFVASPEFPGAIELPAGQVLIRRDAGQVDLCLPDVRVSRVHAWISRKGNVATIGDLKSANGTFVDGQRVREPVLIREGNEIQIGPYVLVFAGSALYPLSHKREAQLVAQDLVCRVPDRQRPGFQKQILDGVSLVARPRELICILGPSGCGKSTLLSALIARRPPDEGRVLLNGEDLVAQFEALKQNLAVVPQREALHESLPLHSVLRYTARLRLPSDTSRSEIDRCISAMLESVRLSEHRATRIRQLSGGQRRRASWVNEAICNPSLILLDEVTSGLDEQTDREMMQLFRKMADDGKTVICVTHRVGYVEQTCHLIAILGAGGVLAFFGPPAECRLISTFRDWRTSTSSSRKKPRKNGNTSSAAAASTSVMWSNGCPGKKCRRSCSPRLARGAGDSKSALSPRGSCRCWSSAYLAILLTDTGMLAMMLGQSLLIALLLVAVFGDISQPEAESEARRVADIAAPGVPWDKHFPETQEEFRKEAIAAKSAVLTAEVLFLLCIACFWFGCNNAAKEIVKERAICQRERDVGLSVVSYYGSKLIVLGVASFLQAALLYACVRLFTHLGGDGVGQFVLLSLVSLTGVALGLALSALARSEDVAVTMVPICLIPQIILAGILAPLAGTMRGLAQLAISAYWGYQGLAGTLESSVQGRLRDASTLDLDREWDLTRVSLVLVVHILVLAVFSVTTLRLRDRKEAGPHR